MHPFPWISTDFRLLYQTILKLENTLQTYNNSEQEPDLLDFV